MISVNIYHKTNQIIAQKCSEKIKALLDSNRYNATINAKVSPDHQIVITIGGDGTFLKAIHAYKKHLNKVRFVAINTGKLGFFCDYNRQEILTLCNELNQLEDQNKITKDYYLIAASYGTKKYLAINEIIITQLARTIVGDIFINGQLLENYKGTGVLCATPLGSSGYNKSINGSVIHPSVKAMIYNEIAPCVNNSQRTLGTGLVLSQNDEVKIVLNKEQHNQDAVIIHDSNVKKINILEENVIKINYCDQYVQKLKLKGNINYIERLKKSFI